MGQKKRKRTAQLETQQIDRYTRSIAQEAIEQHNFRKLVQSGVIVEEREENGQTKKTFQAKH